VNPCFHIAGCVVAMSPDEALIDDCLQWVRRHGAEILSRDDRQSLFVHFDAAGPQLILYGCRAALAQRPPRLRFGFASAVKEAAGDGKPRAGERGLMQARDLAAAAQVGQTLLSSQLGSLLQMAQVEPCDRLRPMQLRLASGRASAAYAVEPLRAAGAAGQVLT
jgi:hypothetical protein